MVGGARVMLEKGIGQVLRMRRAPSRPSRPCESLHPDGRFLRPTQWSDWTAKGDGKVSRMASVSGKEDGMEGGKDGGVSFLPSGTAGGRGRRGRPG